MYHVNVTEGIGLDFETDKRNKWTELRVCSNYFVTKGKQGAKICDKSNGEKHWFHP